jgi:hypothetical protein
MDLGGKAMPVWRSCSSFPPSRVTESNVRYVLEGPRPAKAGVTLAIESSFKASILLKTCRSSKDVKIYGTNTLKSFSINKTVEKTNSN